MVHSTPVFFCCIRSWGHLIENFQFFATNPAVSYQIFWQPTLLNISASTIFYRVSCLLTRDNQLMHYLVNWNLSWTALEKKQNTKQDIFYSMQHACEDCGMVFALKNPCPEKRGRFTQFHAIKLFPPYLCLYIPTFHVFFYLYCNSLKKQLRKKTNFYWIPKKTEKRYFHNYIQIITDKSVLYSLFHFEVQVKS